MKPKRPFTGKVRYKKSYEDEYNLIRESLVKSNLTVIALNGTISSQESIIAELRTTICQLQNTIRNQQAMIDGKKKSIKVSPKIESLYAKLKQKELHKKIKKAW